MNKKRYKYLEEKAKAIGKILLIEETEFFIDPSKLSESIEIFDKPKLLESSLRANNGLTQKFSTLLKVNEVTIIQPGNHPNLPALGL